MDKQFDGFSVNLFMDNEEKWIAHFVEHPEISAFGNTAETALSELSETWCCMKEVYAEKGLPIPMVPLRKNYSGSFNIRVSKALHRALADEAARKGISLNAIVTRKLSESTKNN